jgi:hypothetical protein
VVVVWHGTYFDFFNDTVLCFLMCEVISVLVFPSAFLLV